MGQLGYEQGNALFLSVVDSGVTQSAAPNLNGPQGVPVLIFAGNVRAGPSTVEPFFTFGTSQNGGTVKLKAVGIVKKVILVVSVPHLLELLVDAAAPGGEFNHVLWIIIWVEAAVIDSAMSVAVFPWHL